MKMTELLPLGSVSLVHLKIVVVVVLLFYESGALRTAVRGPAPP